MGEPDAPLSSPHFSLLLRVFPGSLSSPYNEFQRLFSSLSFPFCLLWIRSGLQGSGRAWWLLSLHPCPESLEMGFREVREAALLVEQCLHSSRGWLWVLGQEGECTQLGPP